MYAAEWDCGSAGVSSLSYSLTGPHKAKNQLSYTQTGGDTMLSMSFLWDVIN
jgi:hypothetical protein